MSALMLAGQPGALNQVMRLDHNGHMPNLRRGDAVIWQPVEGFVREGLYVLRPVENGAEVLYLVQNCGGRLRLLWPAHDVDPKTRALKPNACPQEIDIDDFPSICVGFVVARVCIDDDDAMMGRVALQARRPGCFAGAARAPERRAKSKPRQLQKA